MDIKEILVQHALWLNDNTQGKRANLSGANLRGANLSDANLWACIGNNNELKTIQAGAYIITYSKDVMQIGCKRYTIEEWFSFDDITIAAMDRNALEWWGKWKPILQVIING